MNQPGKQTRDEWESVCARCGRCCYEKIDFEGRIYYTELPCEFLDISTSLCRVYENRDVERPGCVKLTREKIAAGFLPADCPYVKDLEGYISPVMLDDEN